MSQPAHLVVGPDGHGVTEYALALAAAADAPVIREEEFSGAPLPAGFIHTTFTDHLFGPSPDAAVDNLLARAGQRRLSVSFHDIPNRRRARSVSPGAPPPTCASPPPAWNPAAWP